MELSVQHEACAGDGSSPVWGTVLSMAQILGAAFNACTSNGVEMRSWWSWKTILAASSLLILLPVLSQTFLVLRIKCRRPQFRSIYPPCPPSISFYWQAEPLLANPSGGLTIQSASFIHPPRASHSGLESLQADMALEVCLTFLFLSLSLQCFISFLLGYVP